MAKYTFEREWRTPHSEGYRIDGTEEGIGRVDIHFTDAGTVYATMCVSDDLSDSDIQELIGEIDERLVMTTDPYRDDFVVTVWSGRQVGVYSDEEEEEEEEYEEGNGHWP